MSIQYITMSFLKNKLVIAGLILFILFVLFKFGYKKDDTPKVAIEKVQTRSIVETVDETGKIYPTAEMKVSVELGSLVNEIYVQDGDTVKQGQAIAIVQTDGTTMVAGKQSNPMASLQKAMGTGQVNPAAIAQAMQQAQQTTVTAPTIKKTTKTTTIYAPMNGIISDLVAKKGERIMTSEFAKVNSINDWEVRSSIGEVDIVKIKEGNPVKISIDALGEKEIVGVVYRIANNTGNNSLGNLTNPMMSDATNYRVFIKMDKESLKSLAENSSANYILRTGMNASIKIATNTKNNILTIPIKAVTTRYENEENVNNTKKPKSQTVVFVVENNIVKKRVVDIGIQDMEYIEVISGLKKDDAIVVEPYEALEKTLVNDMKVKVLDSKVVFKKQ